MAKIDYAHPETLKKDDLCKIVASKAGLTKKDAKAAIDAFTETVREQVGKGKSIALIGFGTFKVAHRDPRKGRNPQTGEPIDIAASDKLSFHSTVSY